MDSGTLITLSIVIGLAFPATSQAKDYSGKKYGIIVSAIVNNLRSKLRSI